MEITDRILEETEFIKKLHSKVQNIGQNEAFAITDRIRKNQPFLIALLMSFESDVNEDQFDHLMEMFYVIYLFFEEKTNIKKTEITEEIFENQYELNLQFIEYLDGEESQESQLELGASDLSRMHFKSLYTSMIFLTDENEYFGSKDEELKEGTLTIMKALIECMEANLLNPIN